MITDNKDLNYNIDNNVVGCVVVMLLIVSIFLMNICDKGYEKEKQHKCVISNSHYPEIQEVVDNKDMILDELSDIIINENWSTWGSSYDKKKLSEVPRFSDMSKTDKMKHLLSNRKRLGDEQSWKVFGLILEKFVITENVTRCPKTYDLVKNIPGLINAGFSCLEPHSKTPYHNDKDDRFYRVHVPLIIPDVPDDEIRLDVYDDKKQLIKLNWKTNYFVFNDNCFHQAFNNTDRHRIVLLLDIERRI